MSDDAPTTGPAKIPNIGKKAKDLNEVIRYTLWSVFKLKDALPEDRAGFADEVQELFDQLAAKDVTVRGTYDVSGLRADADLMIWWHAETSDQLQEAYNLFRRTKLGAPWSRSGRTWRCTAPPSSTARTSRRSSPTRRRATM